MQTKIIEAQARAIALGLNPATLLPFAAGWERPGAEDIRLVLQLSGLTDSQAGLCAGVEARTIRKWKAAAPAATFGGWCLLVYAAGLGFIPANSAIYKEIKN